MTENYAMMGRGTKNRVFKVCPSDHIQAVRLGGTVRHVESVILTIRTARFSPQTGWRRLVRWPPSKSVRS